MWLQKFLRSIDFQEFFNIVSCELKRNFIKLFEKMKFIFNIFKLLQWHTFRRHNKFYNFSTLILELLVKSWLIELSPLKIYGKEIFHLKDLGDFKLFKVKVHNLNFFIIFIKKLEIKRCQKNFKIPLPWNSSNKFLSFFAKFHSLTRII